MNTFMNLKTSEKSLQFGATKCKWMLVGKDKKNGLNTNLVVDSWKVEYVDNLETGDYDLVETHHGKIDIEKTETHKYLGFVLSSTGDNMININREMFESSMVFINSMLRSSILYAAETNYD